MQLRGWVALCLAMGSVLVLERAAKADVKFGNEKGLDTMIFDDDKLLKSNLGPEVAKIGHGHTPVRTLLVRPRVQFVPELMKTIENL